MDLPENQSGLSLTRLYARGVCIRLLRRCRGGSVLQLLSLRASGEKRVGMRSSAKSVRNNPSKPVLRSIDVLRPPSSTCFLSHLDADVSLVGLGPVESLGQSRNSRSLGLGKDTTEGTDPLCTEKG